MPIDMSMVSKAPPARSGGSKATARAPRATITDQREQAVQGLFQIAGTLCVFTHQYADAAAIGTHSPPISHEVAVLAAADDKVAKAVDSLLTVGPYSALVMAVLPLAMQLAVNHGILPADKIPGTTNPQVLSTKMEAEMSQQAASMLEEAKAAQRDAEERMMALNGAGMPGDGLGAPE